MTLKEYWIYGVFSTTVKAENETQAIRLVENMGLSDLDRWDITDIEED